MIFDVNGFNASKGTGFALGQIVLSKAGHDKGRAYIVVQVLTIKGATRVFVADGNKRTSTSPKPKNPLHLQPTNTVIAALGRLLEGGFAPSDADVRDALELFGDKHADKHQETLNGRSLKEGR